MAVSVEVCSRLYHMLMSARVLLSAYLSLSTLSIGFLLFTFLHMVVSLCLCSFLRHTFVRVHVGARLRVRALLVRIFVHFVCFLV